MQFSLIARGCEDVAVALITADSLKAAVEIVVPKFRRTPDSVTLADTHGRISFEGFLDYDAVADVLDFGDLHGDVPTTYIVRPLPIVPYVKTGTYSD